ncbi:hypothetical protein AV521_22305 [Streptomyces sp. IMTB 2501]|nr:hypothetical protein AV521_22305 [Streptomyces sp. IMTB 2501]
MALLAERSRGVSKPTALPRTDSRTRLKRCPAKSTPVLPRGSAMDRFRPAGVRAGNRPSRSLS